MSPAPSRYSFTCARGSLRALALAAAAAAWPRVGVAQATPQPPCNPFTYYDGRCVDSPTPFWAGDTCCLEDVRWCGNGELAGDPIVSTNTCWNPQVPRGRDLCTPACGSTAYLCPNGVGTKDDQCEGQDDNADGCIDGGCTKGEGECACIKTCSKADCTNPQPADCKPNPPNPQEPCAGGTDDNCDGNPGGSCAPFGGGGGGGGCSPSDPKCGPPPGGGTCDEKLGGDPIVLGSQSVTTEPFTDFGVEFVSKLNISRTYNSNDVSIVRGGPIGPFGLGWHSDWEASLRCNPTTKICTLTRGLLDGIEFKKAGKALSLDGSETWDIYAARGAHHDVLVRRTNGTWLLYFSAAGVLQFQTVCDACSAADQTSPNCTDPLNGGVARVVSVSDGAGNAVTVNYDRPNGVLLGLYDDLGHSLEVRNPQACATGLASELRFDGSLVASYGYLGQQLDHVADATGAVMRSYSYGGSGLLGVIRNEAGSTVAEFSYDDSARAIGIVDQRSSVGVVYGANPLCQHE